MAAQLSSRVTGPTVGKTVRMTTPFAVRYPYNLEHAELAGIDGRVPPREREGEGHVLSGLSVSARRGSGVCHFLNR